MLVDGHRTATMHGREWESLVSLGWATMFTEERDGKQVATMIRQYSASLGRDLRPGESRGW